MKPEQQADNLEKALLERATRLAQDYIQRAEQQRNEIEHEANERLRIREEREVLAAKSEADRLYQQQVQANELRLQAKLDHLRWQMIQQLKDSLSKELKSLSEDEKSYRPVLGALIKHAVQAIETEEVVVEVNARDRKRLQGEWQSLLDEAGVKKKLRLSDETCDAIGGALATDPNNRIRVDNTFNGRIERLQETLDEIIMEKLFSKAVTMAELLHG
jgi:V/A-type H+-transporting ATPase subunit E